MDDTNMTYLQLNYVVIDETHYTVLPSISLSLFNARKEEQGSRLLFNTNNDGVTI